MPDEQQHPMERPIRAWAEQRRRQAGPAFELHNVDRARLHDEVGQVYPTAGRDRASWLPSWRALLPRLVFIGALTSLVVLVLVRLAPVERETSMAQLKPETDAPVIGDDAFNEEVDPGELSREAVVLDRQQRPEAIAEPTAEPAVKARAEAAEPSAVEAHPGLLRRYGLAPAPESAPAPLPSAPSTPASAVAPRPIEPQPDSAVHSADADELPEAPMDTASRVRREVGRRDTLTVSLAAESMPGAEAGPVVLREPDWQNGFVQQSVPRRNFNAPPNLALQAFQLEQRGRAVRVLDEDGSVYLGAMIDNDSSNVALAIPQLSLAGGVWPAHSVGFQVQGTNLSSQRALVFQGLLVTGAMDRIQGQAVIGGRDRIVVDAVEQ